MQDHAEEQNDTKLEAVSGMIACTKPMSAVVKKLALNCESMGKLKRLS